MCALRIEFKNGVVIKSSWCGFRLWLFFQYRDRYSWGGLAEESLSHQQSYYYPCNLPVVPKQFWCQFRPSCLKKFSQVILTTIDGTFYLSLLFWWRIWSSQRKVRVRCWYAQAPKNSQTFVISSFSPIYKKYYTVAPFESHSSLRASSY